MEPNVKPQLEGHGEKKTVSSATFFSCAHSQCFFFLQKYICYSKIVHSAEWYFSRLTGDYSGGGGGGGGA